MRNRIIATLLLLAALLSADPQQPVERDSTYNIALYPVGMYGGETGIGGGAVVYLLHRPAYLAAGDKPNSLNTIVLYTEKKQFSGTLKPEFTLPGGKWAVAAYMKYSFWPDTFYGLGNNTSLDNDEGFATESTKAELTIAHRLSNTLRVETIGYFRRWSLFDREADGVLLNGGVPGAGSTSVTGLGGGLLYDDRDNNFSPLSGGAVQARCIFFDDALGGEWSWTRFELDVSRFFQLWSDGVLGVQAVGVYNDGETPFVELAQLGDKMRGIKEKRFVDRHMLMSRAELRMYPFSGELVSRLGFAVFAETGRVAHEIDEFALDGLKYTVGGGLRFMLLPDERLSVRIDVGFSEDDSDFSIAGTEAF